MEFETLIKYLIWIIFVGIALAAIYSLFNKAGVI